MIETAALKRVRRLEKEQEQRGRQEWQRQQEEQDRIQLLVQNVKNWNKSKHIRDYLKDVKEDVIKKQGVIEPKGELNRWLSCDLENPKSSSTTKFTKVKFPLLSSM